MSTAYRELVIEGPKGWSTGYLRGFLKARGKDGRVINAEAEGFDCEPLRERFRDLVRFGSQTMHLLFPEDLMDDVREAMATDEARARGLRIAAEESVRALRFEFSFEIYSKEHGSRIRKYFRELPEGVELTASIKQREDPSAAGIEAYAPVHAYELSGQGSIEGPVEPVLNIFRRCVEEELIRNGPIHLVYAD